MLTASVFLISDTMFFLKPREDWALATANLKRLVNQGACIVFVPAQSVRFYEFFEAEIGRHRCEEGGSKLPSTVALAVSPYGHSMSDTESVRQRLNQDGYKRARELSTNKPTIEIFKLKAR
jgi:hypothetical protein